MKKLKAFNSINNNYLNNTVKPNKNFIEFKREEINQSIVSRFERQVEKYGNKIAVKLGNRDLTYEELNSHANHIAYNILCRNSRQDLNVSEEDKFFLNKNDLLDSDDQVAIIFDHSIDMVMGIIGVLKSGKTYIPLDPTYPEERLKYILDNTHCKNIVTNNKNRELAMRLAKKTNRKINVINIDNIDFQISKRNMGIYIDPNQIAYILYTSGSTGVPKGVMQSHRNVLHFISVYTNNLCIDSDDRLSLLSSYSFDAAIMDIYGALLNGATLFPFNIKGSKSILELVNWLNSEKITIYHSIPTVYRYIMDTLVGDDGFPYVRLVVMGGEAVYRNDIEKYKKYFSDECIFINGLGPTESTVTLQYFLNKETKLIKESVPVGFPVAETQVLIIKENDEEAEINEVGEIYYRSDYLALGYWNDQKRTNEVFTCNPLIGQGRVYKTGDIGRKLGDGSIEFIGRKDFQVKIRGYRVELGEIESVLDRVNGVNKSVVIGKQDKNKEFYLVAYYMNKGCTKIDENYIKSTLKETLPDYMIPSYFIKLDEMPLTVNGKLDRKELPEPNLDANLNEYEAPRNATEEKLSRIWSEVLDINRIGINDNFFELGGHSLKATVIMSKIHKELNKEIPLKELFKSPTIKELGKYIERIEENPYSKIEKLEEREYYEASSAQKRMYILQKLDKDSVAYNMPIVFEIEGNIDKSRLEGTFKKMFSRHEVLRTYFETYDDQIVQKIDNVYNFKLVDRKKDEEIQKIINGFVKSFELEKAPLSRVELVENMKGTYLLIDMHHIISDGVSMKILIDEFVSLYNGEDLESLKFQYKDFAAWQNKFLKSEEMKKQEEYWLNRFSEEIPVLNIPTDYERPSVQSFEGNSIEFEVDEKLTEDLKKLAKETGTTMHMVLLSAFNILLSKYSGQEDIIIGTPVVGRLNSDIQDMIGVFVNTLALRNKPEGNKKYIDFLKEVKENALEAYENQSYQLETLIEKLDIRRDISRNPLFDIMFNMADIRDIKEIKLNDIELKQYSSKNKVSKFDLTLNVLENNNILELNIEYSTKLFNKDTIERMSAHYINILNKIISNTEVKLCEIDLLSENERHKILYEFNDTKKNYPKDKMIHELFERQVESTPDNIAVVFEEKELTYGELNEKSNSLARVLRKKGVKADSIVGIMVERSLEMIVGIMGILKSGGAYLPIDPNYPKERIEYMLEDSETKILLSSSDILENIEYDVEVINLFNNELYAGNYSNLEKINYPNNLAYIMYTSGTTGNPKGVMIEHKNLVAYVYSFLSEFDLIDKDVVLQQATYCFDGFVEEVYPILLVGGKFVICSKNDALNIKKIEDIVAKNSVSVISCSPLYLNELNKSNKLGDIHTFISGGDVLRQNYYDNLTHAKIYNTYGPTETTVCSSYYRCDDKDTNNILIGKPIKNYTSYIVNKYNNLLPIGVVGELCISGDGLARGYINKEKLTTEKFVDNPFKFNEKMYKTGDLARWLSDGNIEFLGRVDNQVKIRGFRVELREIENKLLEHEDVKEVAVLIKETKDNDKYIYAYIVSDKGINDLSLKMYLKKSLPEYMIPSYFIQLDKMPLTPNGKLDRKVLPEQNLFIHLNEYEAPRNIVEEKLSKIWSEVLGIDRVGINDNFFELGGHSLKIVELINRIYKELNIELSFKDIFTLSTIKDLANFMLNVQKKDYFFIDRVYDWEHYPVSREQKQFLITNQLNKDDLSYNIPIILLVKGKLDLVKMENTFKYLIDRHEILRTSFIFNEGEFRQLVNKKYCFKIDTYYCELEDIIKELVSPFNLERTPLLKVKLVIDKCDQEMLFIDVHHIACDGLSIDILIHEVTQLYNGNTLEKIDIQYKDYSVWQNNYLNSDYLKALEQYWLSKMENFIYTKLPQKYSKNSIGLNAEINFEDVRFINIDNYCKKNKITKFSYFTGILNIILMKELNQKDIIIGTSVASRNNIGLQNLIGLFLNVVLIRTNIDKNHTIKEFLKIVNSNIADNLNHQEYPYEELHHLINTKYGMKNEPLYSIMINYMPYNENVKTNSINLDDVNLKLYKKAKFNPKCDITFYIEDSKDNILINMVYRDIIEKYIIERIVKAFYSISDIIVNNDMIKIGDIKYTELTDK